ncbi:hypothetical protein Tco_0780769 [Tanacetum coccineum]
MLKYLRVYKRKHKDFYMSRLSDVSRQRALVDVCQHGLPPLLSLFFESVCPACLLHLDADLTMGIGHSGLGGRAGPRVPYEGVLTSLVVGEHILGPYDNVASIAFTILQKASQKC